MKTIKTIMAIFGIVSLSAGLSHAAKGAQVMGSMQMTYQGGNATAFLNVSAPTIGTGRVWLNAFDSTTHRTLCMTTGKLLSATTSGNTVRLQFPGTLVEFSPLSNPTHVVMTANGKTFVWDQKVSRVKNPTATFQYESNGYMFAKLIQ